MGKCESCGNDYQKYFEIHMNNKVYLFDSFECAIHLLAPPCQHCGCKIIGHGIENEDTIFCCAHCLRKAINNSNAKMPKEK